MEDLFRNLDFTALQNIDRIYSEFEGCWKNGQTPQIEDHIRNVTEAERPALFHSLLRLELELLGKVGIRASRSEYLGRFRPFSEIVNALFDEVQPAASPNTPPPLVDRVTDPQMYDAPPPPPPDAGGYHPPDPAPPPEPAPPLFPEDLVPAKPSGMDTDYDTHVPAMFEKVVLTVIAGSNQGTRYEFDSQKTFEVGRSADSDLCLPNDNHFSRHHLRLEINPPNCRLVDLGSRNGTFVNGFRVEEAFLNDGDVISGGKTALRVNVVATPLSMGQRPGQSPFTSGHGHRGPDDARPPGSESQEYRGNMVFPTLPDDAFPEN